MFDFWLSNVSYRYFECKDKYGLFAPVARVSKFTGGSATPRRTSVVPQASRPTVRRSNSRESLGGSSVASSTASSVRGTRVRLGVTSLTQGQVLSPNFLLFSMDVVLRSGFLKSIFMWTQKCSYYWNSLYTHCNFSLCWKSIIVHSNIYKLNLREKEFCIINFYCWVAHHFIQKYCL